MRTCVLSTALRQLAVMQTPTPCPEPRWTPSRTTLCLQPTCSGRAVTSSFAHASPVRSDGDHREGAGRTGPRDRRSLLRDQGAAAWFRSDRSKDHDDAVEVASRIPLARLGSIEVRSIMDLARIGQS